MRRQEGSSKRRHKRILNKYIRVAGRDLLMRTADTDIPTGWTNILLETFAQLRSYHPGTQIIGMDINPPRYGFGSRFRFRFNIPDHSSRFPRSLRWIEIQARKKALETCSICGRRLGKLRNKNRCSLCTCKDDVRHFNSPTLPRQA